MSEQGDPEFAISDVHVQGETFRVRGEATGLRMMLEYEWAKEKPEFAGFLLLSGDLINVNPFTVSRIEHAGYDDWVE